MPAIPRRRARLSPRRGHPSLDRAESIGQTVEMLASSTVVPRGRPKCRTAGLRPAPAPRGRHRRASSLDVPLPAPRHLQGVVGGGRGPGVGWAAAIHRPRNPSRGHRPRRPEPCSRASTVLPPTSRRHPGLSARSRHGVHPISRLALDSTRAVPGTHSNRTGRLVRTGSPIGIIDWPYRAYEFLIFIGRAYSRSAH